MATRAIFDGSFGDDVAHYNAFPSEPTIKPDGFFDVINPIEAADKLNPITLVSLMTRMKSLPSTDKKLLIVCHGTKDGLAIPLVAGSTNRADRSTLHILLVLGNAIKRGQQIQSLPIAEQGPEWQTLLNGLKYVDGVQMFPTIDGDSAAACQRFFDYFLNRIVGLKPKFPEDDDIQVITPPPPGSGTIKVTFSIRFPKDTGPSTGQLSPSSAPGVIQAALEGLSTIGSGNIIVTGPVGGPWTCVFVSARAVSHSR